MMNIQPNLNHSKMARDLLTRTVRNLEIDIDIADSSERAAVFFLQDSFFRRSLINRRRDSPEPKSKVYFFYNVYVPPGASGWIWIPSVWTGGECKRRETSGHSRGFQLMGLRVGQQWNQQTKRNTSRYHRSALIYSGTKSTFTRNEWNSMVDPTFSFSTNWVVATEWTVSTQPLPSYHVWIAARGGQLRVRTSVPVKCNHRSSVHDALITMMDVVAADVPGN